MSHGRRYIISTATIIVSNYEGTQSTLLTGIFLRARTVAEARLRLEQRR